MHLLQSAPINISMAEATTRGQHHFRPAGPPVGAPMRHDRCSSEPDPGCRFEGLQSVMVQTSDSSRPPKPKQESKQALRHLALGLVLQLIPHVHGEGGL